MSAPLLQAAQEMIAAFALHAAWQVPLLAASAWVAVRVGRPHPRSAYAVWVATLCMCVVMPAASSVEGRAAALRLQAGSAATATYENGADLGDLPVLQAPPAWKRILKRHVSLRDGIQPFAFVVSERAARCITVAYALIALLFSLRLLMSWLRTRTLLRCASDVSLPPQFASELARQCSELHVQAPVVCMSSGIRGPALAGTLRPTLLLPADAVESMTETEIAAVLAHELAHLRRHDAVAHAVCSLITVPVAFHPAALWIGRRVRQTREMTCDAAAAEQLGSQSRYADALLRVASRSGMRSSRAGLFHNNVPGQLGLLGLELFGLEMFSRKGMMEERMEMIMKPNQSADRGNRAVRIGVSAAIAAAAVLTASMLQVQPALAGERAAQNDAQTHLLSGSHAQQQLQQAHRELAAAGRAASTDDERQKIVTAQHLLEAAQQQIAAASGPTPHVIVNVHDSVDTHALPQVHVDLKSLDSLKDLEALKTLNTVDLQGLDSIELHTKVLAEINSPEFQKSIAQAREAARAQVNSPEMKAQIAAARVAARAQINNPEMKKQIAEARAKAEEARNSPEFRAQIEQARQMARQAHEMARSQQIARNEMPAFPAPEPAPVAAPAPAPGAGQQDTDKPMKTSPGVMQGNKIGGSNPVYPADAKEKHVSGVVVLHAIIDKTGHVQALQVVSSPDDSLSKSASDAVQTWTYRPYLLNGNPTAVDTTINVNFSLMN